MPGDTVKISKAAHLIAIKYGSNVSQGILKMGEHLSKIEQRECEIAERERNFKEAFIKNKPELIQDPMISPNHKCPYCKNPLRWEQFKEHWVCKTHGTFDNSQLKTGV